MSNLPLKGSITDEKLEIIENGGMSRSDFDSCLANKEIENQILKNQIAAQQQFKIKT